MSIIAFRKASKSFEGRYNLRSRRYIDLLRQHQSLMSRLDHSADELTDILYDEFRKSRNQADRRLLLKAKRNVFNKRPIDPSKLQFLADRQQVLIHEYLELLDEATTLFEKNESDVFEEYAQEIDSLLQNVTFRNAIQYSSPSLNDALSKTVIEKRVCKFNDLDRRIYHYAAKFFCKANPFFYFSEIGLVDYEPSDEGHTHEFIFDVQFIYALERSILTSHELDDRLFASLQNYVREGERISFIIYKHGERGLATLRSNPLLEQLIWLLEELPEDGITLGEVRRRFVEAGAQKPLIESLLQQLYTNKILLPYVFRDFNTFYEDLKQYDILSETQIRQFEELHLGFYPTGKLTDQFDHIREVSAKTLPGVRRNTFFINSYIERETLQKYDLESYQQISTDLEFLKPLFTPANSIEVQHQALRNMIKEVLIKRNTTHINYIELVVEFMRNRMDEQFYQQLEALTRAPETLKNSALMDELGQLKGTLSTDDLQEVYKKHKLGRVDSTICFNGVLNFRDSLFYLTNIWAGNRRFISRFLLKQRLPNGHYPETDDEQHVQLYELFGSNKNFTVRETHAGTGLFARFRHGFQHWLSPADILVELKGDRIVYSHRSTGKRLHFHYFGFILLEQLPIEYKLLLLDKADIYTNYFARTVGDKIPDTDLLHYPELQVNQVVLRRPKWLIAKRSVPRPAKTESHLVFARRFKDWLQELLQIENIRYYYRLVLRSKDHNVRRRNLHKPMLLDVANPLSIFAFIKCLKAIKGSDLIEIEPMAPDVPELLESQGEHYLTEIMMEV